MEENSDDTIAKTEPVDVKIECEPAETGKETGKEDFSESLHFEVIDELSVSEEVDGGTKTANENAASESVTNGIKAETHSNQEAEKTLDTLILTADEQDMRALLKLEKGPVPDALQVSGSSSPKNAQVVVAKSNENPVDKKSSPKKEVTKSKCEEKKTPLKEAGNKEGVVTKDKVKPALESGQKGVLWVFNITQAVKATDLKKQISKYGKVNTAKIVTDGKRCFGYVVLESPKDVGACLKSLDGSYLEGNKIHLSTNPPAKRSNKNETKPKPNEKEPKDTKDAKEKSCSKDGKTKPKEEIVMKRKESKSDPLTTKYESSKPHSRNKDEEARRIYLREKEENERLRKKCLEQQKRERQEAAKQFQMEMKFERERKKLQIERQMIEEEKERVARERINVQRQKLKLAENLRKFDKKRKSPESPKPVIPLKYRRECDNPDSRDPKRTTSLDDKSRKARFLSPMRRDVDKTWFGSKERPAYNSVVPTPPPPKLTDDFRAKERSYDFWNKKNNSYPLERKPEPNRRIEVLERKSFGAAKIEKRDYFYRKDLGRKGGGADRKREFEEPKRFRDSFAARDDQRNQWPAPNYAEPWKMAQLPPGSNLGPRCEEGGFPPAPAAYGAPAPRMPPVYYHSNADYSRYE